MGETLFISCLLVFVFGMVGIGATVLYDEYYLHASDRFSVWSRYCLEIIGSRYFHNRREYLEAVRLMCKLQRSPGSDDSKPEHSNPKVAAARKAAEEEVKALRRAAEQHAIVESGILNDLEAITRYRQQIESAQTELEASLESKRSLPSG